jgi:hypothetical protein
MEIKIVLMENRVMTSSTFVVIICAVWLLVLLIGNETAHACCLKAKTKQFEYFSDACKIVHEKCGRIVNMGDHLMTVNDQAKKVLSPEEVASQLILVEAKIRLHRVYQSLLNGTMSPDSVVESLPTLGGVQRSGGDELRKNAAVSD